MLPSNLKKAMKRLPITRQPIDLAELRQSVARLVALLERTGLLPVYSTPASVTDWSDIFKISRDTMGAILADGTIRAKRLGRQKWMIDLRDIPLLHRHRFEPK